MAYIDGFVAAVPTENRAAFVTHAGAVAEIFKKLGARRVVEGWGDDVPEGTRTSFPRAVQAEAGETVVFSWVEWPDKPTRDAAMARLMEEMEAAGVPEMPFDGTRLIFGGFEVALEV